jgi:hypothetical protein
MVRKLGALLLFSLVCIVLLPATVSAQSQITGVARDESGGVLPGVTVEASSPVLIEKVRSAVTDDQGRYTITNLRPGSYRVTFTLTGFNTVVRDGLEVPGGVAVTANADLKVGALEETITVSGQTPLVDVTQATRTQVLTRDLIDALPSTRNIMSVGMMVPGIRLGTPDVGGSRQMEQTNPRGHGIAAKHTVQHIDGMSINSQETSNQQSYVNDALSAEVTVSTSAHPAEIQSGGLRTNMIPKDGGNMVSGSIFLGGSDGAWQSNNVSDEMRAQNFTSANGIAHIQNFNGSMGGPILRDKLWFFASARHISTDELVANVDEYVTAPDGELVRSTLDQYIRDVLGRVTWQISPKNKFSVFFERTWKRKGKDFGFGQDPRSGTQRDPNKAHYGVGQGKFTSTISSKILFEAGYSSSYQHWTGFNLPEIVEPRYLANGQINPAWLNNARRESNSQVVTPRCAYSFGCTAWVSNGQDQRTADAGFRVVSSMSYVTGSHNIKVGFADSFGPVHVFTDRQADLVQTYNNGRPSSVTVYTTPYNRFSYVNYDMGIFGQDSWTIKRLTLNLGARVDNFDSKIEATSMPAGRFAGERYFPEREHVPQWLWDVSPRFSAAYDLFGDGRTALKASFSRYLDPLTGGFADRYSPGAANEQRNWLDCTINASGNACVPGVALPTDNDDIAQAHEIGPGGATFGIREDRDFDENIQRERNTEITFGVQHQLFSRVSLIAQYYRRTFQDMEMLDRELITHSDYTSFQTPVPADVARDPEVAAIISPGTLVTVYNLKPAKLPVYTSQQRDKTNPDISSTYNGFDLAATVRTPGGGTAFGSWTVEKNLSNFCANDDNPNGVLTADRYTGANVAAGGAFCDQAAFDMPFRHEFKMAGTMPVRWGIDLGAVLQSYAGGERVITWVPPVGVFTAAGQGRTRSETVVLNEPGSLYYPRYNQVDFNVKKTFRAGRKTFSGQIDWFNLLNGNAIFTRNSQVGASLGQIQTILQGRLTRLAFQMKW